MESTGASLEGGTGAPVVDDHCQQDQDHVESTGDTGGMTQERSRIAPTQTMILSNVPAFMTGGALLSLFEDLSVNTRGSFDFFYCPWDPNQKCNLGYIVVNFFTEAAGAEFKREWSNRDFCKRRLRIMPAGLQGLRACVQYFSNFSLANQEDPRFRPFVRGSPTDPVRPMALPDSHMQESGHGQQVRSSIVTAAPPALGGFGHMQLGNQVRSTLAALASEGCTSDVNSQVALDMIADLQNIIHLENQVVSQMRGLIVNMQNSSPQ
jgi:hypothetical protein